MIDPIFLTLIPLVGVFTFIMLKDSIKQEQEMNDKKTKKLKSDITKELKLKYIHKSIGHIVPFNFLESITYTLPSFDFDDLEKHNDLIINFLGLITLQKYVIKTYGNFSKESGTFDNLIDNKINTTPKLNIEESQIIADLILEKIVLIESELFPNFEKISA